MSNYQPDDIPKEVHEGYETLYYDELHAGRARIAQLEAERDALRAENDALRATAMSAVCDTTADALECISLRAELAALREAGEAALIYIHADEVTHGRSFGAGNLLRAALTSREVEG